MLASTGTLTINLSAIADNWTLLKNKLCSSQAFCASVVKADAYGLGVDQVAPVLKQVGCQHFFVATLDEAVALRGFLGDDVAIFVFGGTFHGLESDIWFRYQLIPVLFDSSHLCLWARYCQFYKQLLPCAIKFDTGMHRLGISLEQLDDLSLELINPVLLMSHLACADQIDHPFNDQQLLLFQHIAERFFHNFSVKTQLSLANSSGIFLGGAYHFDMARPGAALYGVNPRPEQTNPMSSVVNLSLPVMQYKSLYAGQSVGYGATYVAEKNRRIAIVFGGYADGLSRHLSNQGHAYVEGVKVPILGRISMDSMVFDVTEAKETGEIEVLNAQQTVDDFARIIGTIGYEVLTSLGRRYQRCYFRK